MASSSAGRRIGSNDGAEERVGCGLNNRGDPSFKGAKRRFVIAVTVTGSRCLDNRGVRGTALIISALRASIVLGDCVPRPDGRGYYTPALRAADRGYCRSSYNGHPKTFGKYLQSPASFCRALTELVPVSFVLSFHLSHELNEFGCLSDAAQISVTREQRVTGKTRDGAFS